MLNMEKDIELCLKVLHAGGLILYPTDTIWGIGCDATNPSAVEKVYRLKNRAEKKSLIILLADERDLNRYITLLDPAIFDYLETVQTATTIIYDGAISLADNCINEDSSIAIRIIQEPFCKALIKRFRKPIVSTSANVSGMPAPAHFGEVSTKIKNGVDYIVEYRQDDFQPAKPSNIIRFLKDGSIVPIRIS